MLVLAFYKMLMRIRKSFMQTQTSTHHRWRTTTMLCAAAGLMFCAVGAALGSGPARAQKMPQPSVRSLSGSIRDSGHEPIRNAVVELRNTNTGVVITYITDESGRYNFKRLDGNADYEVWVLFRGYRSPTRSISKFDSHMVKVIDFIVRTY